MESLKWRTEGEEDSSKRSAHSSGEVQKEWKKKEEESWGGVLAPAEEQGGNYMRGNSRGWVALC